MKVVFYSPDSYSLFLPGTNYIFGGAETRVWRFARGLALLPRYEVHVITANQGVSHQMSDRVHVWPHPEKYGAGYWIKRRTIAGRIAHRFGTDRSSRFRKLDELLGHIKPDVILILGMCEDAWTLMQYAQSHRCRFIFGCASDLDFSREYLENSNGVDVTGNSTVHYAEVLKQADTILVQTPEQMTQLREVFARSGELLLNPVNFSEGKVASSYGKADVLWVGKSSKLKQPEIFLELARSLPDLKFLMVLNCADVSIFERCINNKTPNLIIIESIPYSEIDSLFTSVSMFVNTSTTEGFANTFLQAGMAGIPIVSMNADPNGMLSGYGCGILCGNTLDALTEAIRDLMADDSRRNRLGQAALWYVKEFHDETKQVRLLSKLIEESLQHRTADKE